MKKKLLLTSAFILSLGIAGCGGNQPVNPVPDNGGDGGTGGGDPVVPVDPYVEIDPDDDPYEVNVDENGVPEIFLEANVLNADDYEDAYLKESANIYNKNYGKFYKSYVVGSSRKKVSERYAYQAIAEAKLMETGTLLPGSSNGGSYAISRIIPYTITPINWGQDNYRYHDALILKGNPLTAAERADVKAKYAELSAAGGDDAQDKYITYVKNKFSNREFNRTYTLYYDGDPETYDIHNSYYATDSEPLVNTFDGLVEYNGMNQLKPALASSWEMSNDGLEYTFTIRDGAIWTDKDGNKVADVLADDFVAGFQHMLDCAGGLEYLVEGIVKNASEYLKGDCEFGDVGVKAAGNKVTYTLVKPVSYFMTMLSYSIFAPMSRSYYKSQGGQFGDDFDDSATNYQYAKDYDHIAYCGPYLIQSFIPKNTFEFVKNDKYWNKDNINIDKIVWLENDGTDSLKGYNGMKNEIVASCGLNAEALVQAKTDNMFDTYGYVSGVDASTYPFYINLNRKAYANHNDNTKGVSGKSDDAKALTKAALSNPYIRLGLEFAIDRSKYYEHTKGEELALKSAVNSYTPGNFVKTEEAVTVKINGKDKSFPAGTYYGAIMQAQIDADKMPMKVWDQTLEAGLGSSAGYDGWFNAEQAAKFFNKGVAQLKAAGTEIKADKPLNIELVTVPSVSTTDNPIHAMGASIKAVLGDLVDITYVDCPDRATLLHAEYYPEVGYETNCDIMTISGWGPDFGDPDTYLATFTPSTGGMLKCSGIF